MHRSWPNSRFHDACPVIQNEEAFDGDQHRTRSNSDVDQHGSAGAGAQEAAVGEAAVGHFLINSVAMSNDGSRVVAATFIHDYRQRTGKFQPNVQSRFGTHLFDDAKNSPTAPKWSDEFDGSDGVFGVAISGDGKVAAASGWLEKTGNTPVGLLRAYDATDSKPDSIKVLLDYRDSNQRISWVALSDDGKVLTAVADDVYVFFRDGKAFNPVPVRLGVGGIANRYVTAVALHPSGTWLAACDASGHVHVARIANGAISTMITWTAPKEFPFLSVAIARDSQTFVVGGGNSVFHFAFDASGNLQAPIEYRHDSEPGPGDHSPRQAGWETSGECSWVAISADGTLLTAVANRIEGTKFTGLLVALTPEPNQLKKLWDKWLDNNPNSTSIDAAGMFVAVADGYPTSKPAAFHLFDANGQKLWDFGTCNMNWPMVVSPDGSAIAAGSDDGTVYYFKP